MNDISENKIGPMTKSCDIIGRGGVISMSSLIPPVSRRPSVRQSALSEDAGPIKATRQMREVFREAFDALGGAEWLVAFATENDQNARVFVQAISKLLPPSANPKDDEKVIIDVPWLTSERLEYKRVEDAVVVSIK